MTSCDEEMFGKLTVKQWEAAVESNNFNNVTITTEITYEGALATQVVKITETGFYREAHAAGSNDVALAEYYEGEQATNMKNMFLTVFFELVSNKDNFVYDEANDQYTAPSDITVTVYPYGEEVGYKDVALMKDALVKFDEDYNLSYFSCIMTEKIYIGDSTEPEHQSPATQTVWYITNYGKTVITAEEMAAGSSAQ
jgi:hypothetical protein